MTLRVCYRADGSVVHHVWLDGRIIIEHDAPEDYSPEAEALLWRIDLPIEEP